MKETISYDDFAKIDIRIGRIVTAEMVPEADKLIKCTIDFGTEIGIRTIVSGIRAWYTPEELVGKHLPYIINLAPRTLKGVVSEGMLLAAGPVSPEGERGLCLVVPVSDVIPGTTLG